MIPQLFVSCLLLSTNSPFFLISSILPQTLFPLLPQSPKLQIHPYPLVSISILQFVPSPIAPLKKTHTFPLVSFKAKHSSEILKLTRVPQLSLYCSWHSILFPPFPYQHSAQVQVQPFIQRAAWLC